jgi:hypothetical protein
VSFSMLSHDNLCVVPVAIRPPRLPMAIAGGRVPFAQAYPVHTGRRSAWGADDGTTRPPSRRIHQENEQPPGKSNVGEQISIKPYP